jgi:hypothetical protein
MRSSQRGLTILLMLAVLATETPAADLISGVPRIV